MAFDALILEVEGVLFGISSSEVVQVVRAVAMNQIPNSPPSVEGAINVRGHVMPVLDLRYLTQLPRKELELTDHLIVLRLPSREVAIRVDRAVDLVRLDETQLDQNSAMETPLVGRVAHTAHGFVHLLDWSRLLTPDTLSTLTTVTM